MTRAASVVVPFPRRDAGDRLDLARLVPSGRSLLVAFALVVAVLGAYWGAVAILGLRRRARRGRGRSARRSRARSRSPRRTCVGTSLLDVDARAVEDAVRALPVRRGRLGRPSVPEHPRRQGCRRAARRRRATRALGVARDRGGQGDPGDRDRGRARLSAALADRASVGVESAGRCPPDWSPRRVLSPLPARRGSRGV